MPISSVFFAVLHLEEGPKIVYQVPEGLITTPPRSFVPQPNSDLSTSVPSPPPINTSNTPTSTVSPTRPPLTSKAQASSTTGSSQLSTTGTAGTAGGGGPAPLFEFELISQFTIPQAELCGRLMICTTRKHRIVGFPIILKGAHYWRGMFQYNLCFVFQRDLDVSPYEPVVRKVARVLTVCEVCSGARYGGTNYLQIFGIYRKSAGFFRVRLLVCKYTQYSSNSLPISIPSRRHRSDSIASTHSS